MDGLQEKPQMPTSQTDEIDRKARVDAVWQQMNKGVSAKALKTVVAVKKPNPAVNKVSAKKVSSGWMNYLGLASNKAASSSPTQGGLDKCSNTTSDVMSEDAKRIAAAAIAAVKDAALVNAGRGKVEITEVRNFAGEEIEVKKLVDAASEKGKAAGAGSTSAVDAVLDQIRKKPKLSVLDKTKKDWGEFKDENKGLEDELDTYKKSSNQYLDRVNFLQRADYREFERERDVRLAQQSKRKTDMRDD